MAVSRVSYGGWCGQGRRFDTGGGPGVQCGVLLDGPGIPKPLQKTPSASSPIIVSERLDAWTFILNGEVFRNID